VKYGALSIETGRIAIGWNVQAEGAGEAQFTLTWTEEAGPSVSTPERHGFGSKVTSTMVETSVGGGVSAEYAPTGLVWRLASPVTNIVAGALPEASTKTPVMREASGGRRPADRRILVVEDEPLLAAEIGSILSNAGFHVIGPAASVSQALALIEHEGCDSAVLDVNLGGETSEPVAMKLIRTATPFVVVSGYARAQMPEVFRTAPLVRKPLPSALLEAEVKRSLGTADARH
jgi:CheY-like chemotaxis protein